MISNAYPQYLFYINGNFKLPGISWDPSSGAPRCLPTTLSGVCSKFGVVKEIMDLFALRQFNFICNPSGNVLDLCLSGVEELTLQQAEPLLPLDRHHPPFECAFSIGVGRNGVFTPRPFQFNFKKADFQGMKSHLMSVCWDFCSLLPLEQAVSEFYRILEAAIGRFVPRVTPVDQQFPKCFTSDLKSLVRRKNQAHARWKCTGLTDDYSLLRAQCRSSRGLRSQPIYNRCKRR